jgi:hypothetical protein
MAKEPGTDPDVVIAAASGEPEALSDTPSGWASGIGVGFRVVMGDDAGLNDLFDGGLREGLKVAGVDRSAVMPSDLERADAHRWQKESWKTRRTLTRRTRRTTEVRR